MPLHELVPGVPPALVGRRGGRRSRWTPRSATPAPRRWPQALGDGLRGVFPERAEATAATSLLAAEDETAATRMLEGSPRTEAPVRPRQPRRPRPPVEPVGPPAVRDRDAAAADRRRQRDQPPKKRRRWIALLLVLLVIGAGIAAVVVLTNQSNAVKAVPVNGRDVNTLVDQLHQLVDDNTR